MSNSDEFFIADITGTLSPYAAETFRIYRENAIQARLERLGAPESLDEEALAAARLRPGDDPADHPNIGKQQPVHVGPSAQAVGLAGATALHRGQEASERGDSEVKPSSRENERRGRFPREHVQGVSRLGTVKNQSERPGGQTRPFRAAANPYEKLNDESQHRQPAIRASQIMSSPVVSLDPQATLESARGLFRTHRFRHLPVVGESSKVIGILSDRDVLAIHDHSLLVRDAMITHVLSAHPDTAIRHIAKIMFQERIGAMPIISTSGELEGIVTRSDILRTVVNEAPLELWL